MVRETKKDIWQFTTINHLSWADIFLFLYFTNFATGVPKIFKKACYGGLLLGQRIGLAMPFVEEDQKKQSKP